MRTVREITKTDVAKLEWMSIHEIATQLGCSDEHVRTLCLSGELAYANVGTGERNRYRVHVGEFQAFLRRRQNGPAHKPKPRKTAVPELENLCGM